MPEGNIDFDLDLNNRMIHMTVNSKRVASFDALGATLIIMKLASMIGWFLPKKKL